MGGGTKNETKLPKLYITTSQGCVVILIGISYSKTWTNGIVRWSTGIYSAIY